MDHKTIINQEDYEQEDKDIRCPICSFYFSSLTKPYILPCNHNLCLDCIDQLISSQSLSSASCPICHSKFRKEDRDKFQVNYAFLNLVIKVLKTKAIYCKKCSKIYNWSDHHLVCAQSEFKETNEIINDIRQLGDECFVLLKYFSHHQNIATSSKKGVYTAISEIIESVNNKFFINCEKSVESFYDNVPNINLDTCKKEIVKFLEQCRSYYESFESFNIKQLDELLDKNKEILNSEANDDSSLSNHLKGRELKGYQNDLQMSKNGKKSLSPLHFTKKKSTFEGKDKQDNQTPPIAPDSDDDYIIISDEEVSQENTCMKIHSFVNPQIYTNNTNIVPVFKGNIMKQPDISDINENLIMTGLFNDENGKEEDQQSTKKKIIISNKGVQIVPTNLTVNKYKRDSSSIASEIRNSFSNIRESECDENYSSCYDISCPEENYDKIYPYSGANPLPLQKINQQYPKFTIGKPDKPEINKSATNNDMISRKINIDADIQMSQNTKNFAQINKIMKNYNKMKDITSKLLKYSSVINKTTHDVNEQIEKNYSLLKNQINNDLIKLLDNIQFNFKQTTKRFLVSFIPFTKKVLLYDIKKNKTEIKIFEYLPYKFNQSMSIEFDDCDLIFLSGGCEKEDSNYSKSDGNQKIIDIINKLLIFRWSSNSLTGKFEGDCIMPIRRAYHSSIYFGNRLYIIGGISQNKLNVRECANYSIIEHKWEQMPYINYPRRNPSLCIYNQSYLYVFRGSDKEMLLDTIEFLHLNNQSLGWTVFQPEDPGRSWFGCELSSVIVMGENKILICGGVNENGALNHHCFIFDPIKKTVYRGRDLAMSAAFSTSGIYLQDKIYTIDVRNSLNKSIGIHIYDVKNCTWTFA